MKNQNKESKTGQILSKLFARKKMKQDLKDLKRMKKRGEELMKRKLFIKLE